MVKVTVAVSLIERYGSDHCTGIRLIQAEDTTTLKELRAHIAKQLPCDLLYLLYRGCEVSDALNDSTLKDCCPTSVSCLRFSVVYVRNANPQQIFVKALTGHAYSFGVKIEETTVTDLQRMVCAVTDIPTYQHRLIFAGKQLEKARPLSDYGVQREDAIHLCLSMRISSWLNTTGFAVNTVDSNDVQWLGEPEDLTTVPEWRMCKEGLNIEGKCGNSFCCVYQRTTTAHCDSQFSMSFSRIVEQALCPVCSCQFVPQGFGFRGCLWAYDSCQTGENLQLADVSNNWQHVSYDQYRRFQLDTRGWDMLKFSVQLIYNRCNRFPDQQISFLPCPVCHEIPKCSSGITAHCGHSFHSSCLEALLAQRWLPCLQEDIDQTTGMQTSCFCTIHV